MRWDLARKMTMLDAAQFAEPFYPHVMLIGDRHPESWTDVRSWCAERFGICGSYRPEGYIGREYGHGRNNHGHYKVTLSAEWLQLGDYFAFRDEDAAFEFRMRWG